MYIYALLDALALLCCAYNAPRSNGRYLLLVFVCVLMLVEVTQNYFLVKFVGELNGFELRNIFILFVNPSLVSAILSA